MSQRRRRPRAGRPRAFLRLQAVFSAAQVEPLLPPAQPVASDPPIAELKGDRLAWACGLLTLLAGERRPPGRHATRGASAPDAIVVALALAVP